MPHLCASQISRALDNPAFKWNHLRRNKMIEIHRFRASDNPKTTHTFGSDALAQRVWRASDEMLLRHLDRVMPVLVTGIHMRTQLRPSNYRVSAWMARTSPARTSNSRVLPE
jgi:hypothetical protein